MSVRSRLEEAGFGLVPYRHQVEGIRFLERTEGRALVADEMATGKSGLVMGWLKLNSKALPAVLVVPATIKENWRRQLGQVAGLRCYVAEGVLQDARAARARLQGRLARLRRRRSWRSLSARRRRGVVRSARKRLARTLRAQEREVRKLLRAEVVVINYDILAAWLPVLRRLGPRCVVYDESHHLTNRAAIRTRAAKKLAGWCRHVIALSGTPIDDRPAEFWPVLNMVRPDLFPSFFEFGWAFCDPSPGWGGRWEFKGASNLKKLHRLVSEVMIRRLKKDVLKDLPPKRRIVVPLDIDNAKDYARARDDFVDWLEDEEGVGAVQRARGALALVRMAKLKKLAALGKLEGACRWIEDWLEETDQKLVIYAIHKEVLELLQLRFPGSAFVSGKTPVRKRQGQVDMFVRSKRCRTFLGQLKVLGQGVDGLQEAASATVTLELAWNDAPHLQADDRVHRPGQRARSTENYYLVAKDTIEEWLLELIHEKQVVVDKVLEGRSPKKSSSLLSMLLERV